MGLRFTKMHGAGNDFAIVDCRERPLALGASQIARFGDRHFGVGFDQLLTIERSSDASCAFAYGIYNQDGRSAKQCGNGVRCVAAWLHRDGAIGIGAARLSSPSGTISVEVLDAGLVRAGMGVPRFAPHDVPLKLPAADPYALHLNNAEVEFGALSIGNPHAVIEVADVAMAPLPTLGAALSIDPHFPQGANVGFVQIIDRGHLRLRVWERGAGATLACGTGACAAVAVLRLRGKVDANVAVDLPGGTLQIDWLGEGRELTMTGPAEFVFEGEY
ncbi:MAG TPA: diaminopimelate epimerase [Rudaea sp.]|jgi:diaminopimelate epimerase